MKRNFWKSKKVLITGHSGFLGSNLTRYLLEKGSCVIGVDINSVKGNLILGDFEEAFVDLTGNICDLDFVKSVVNRYRPQVIFHLAAETIVSESKKNPLKTFKSNIEGTWNILEIVRDKKFIDAVVVASSDKAYGKHEKLPYKENAALRGNHPYDVSKSCTDLICATFWNTYQVPVCVTRCGNIYGQGDLHLSRIIPGVIHCLSNGKTLMIRSNGRFTRDYIYVDDVISGYVILAEKIRTMNLGGHAFNFSYEYPISVIKLVKTIYTIFGNKGKYKILNQAKAEIEHQYLSSSKARRVLGWRPQNTLEQGLAKTINWYQENIYAKK